MSSLPVLEISGNAGERGRQHGEALREGIRRSVEYYREMYLDRVGASWQDAVGAACERVPAIQAYAPDLIDEVRGIAEGAGRPFDELLWLNGRAPARRLAATPEAQDGCTSFAVLPRASDDGHTYSGQNWDWRAAIRDTVVFMRISQPPKPTILMQVEAGQIARQGANAAGIALNANGLPGGSAVPDGIPGPYVRRRALDSWTLRDALLAVYEAQPTGRVNLLLTHRDGVAIDLEVTPGRIGVLEPRDGVLVHGNHFASFVPDDRVAVDRPTWIDSLYRVPRVADALRATGASRPSLRTLETIGHALRDHFGHPHGVCRHVDQTVEAPLRNETLVSSIVDLTSGEYWVTVGPPCEAEHRRLPWGLYEAGST